MSSFEEIVGDLDYAMAIVTVSAGGERAGCLVGFASQCSIDPPRFCAWLSKQNHTYRVAREAEVLVVHLPAADQGELARLFGAETGDEVDKFERCRWSPGPGGAPVLADTARWFAGRVVDRVDTGDHVGFVLEPGDGEAGPWPGPLTFQAVKDLDPGHPA